ncbi:MAG TPA: hypothetical protein VN873_04905 [Candidatus Angelobacter sp.]|nr:hypothetical protein [Candidatus Angelobacter sp.]
MKPEKQNLIGDLLEEDSRREETLLAGARILRHRRHSRSARQGMTFAAIVLAAILLCVRHHAPRSTPAQIASRAPKPAPATQVEALTDDQLLALFPNTPVALASLPGGKKQLIFPRPGDEQRFIKRL